MDRHSGAAGRIPESIGSKSLINQQKLSPWRERKLSASDIPVSMQRATIPFSAPRLNLFYADARPLLKGLNSTHKYNV